MVTPLPNPRSLGCFGRGCPENRRGPGGDRGQNGAQKEDGRDGGREVVSVE